LYFDGCSLEEIKVKKINVSSYSLLLAVAACAALAVAQTPGTFTPTGNMTTPRRGHSATLLKDGRVLIAGGNFDGPPSAELYDPATGTFTATGNMIRGGIPALLQDGTVLFISSTGVELFDPSTGIFTDIAVGNMIGYRGGGTATLLDNGKVLITGGTNGFSDCCAIAADPVVYDPSTQMFSFAGPYADTGAPSFSATFSAGTSGLAFAPATLLQDGKVLISSESAAELYDPVSNSFSLTASMTALGDDGGEPTSIYGRTATLLPNGNVLVTGGSPIEYDTDDYDLLSSAELYVPSSGTFMSTGNMALPRRSHAATLLADGTVLITGGGIDGFDHTSPIAELYDPITGMFSQAGSMESGRLNHQATLLQDGRVLITGGSSFDTYPNQGVPASAEIYTPPAEPWQQAITAMKTAGGSDSFNFWQWDWLWQRSPAFPGAPAGFGVLGSIDNTPGFIEKIIAAGGGNGLQNISAELWVLYYRQALDPWQRAIAAMQGSAGTNSLNFWQWAWYWQRSPVFAGAPAGFGVLGSIDNTPGAIDKIIAMGGGDGFAVVSAEQWLLDYQMVLCAGCWYY